MTASTVSSPRLALSPSKLSTFANCGLHYKFQYVDKIPEPPTKDTVLGNILHRALELLYQQPQWDRSPARLGDYCVQAAVEHYEELCQVGLWITEAEELVATAFMFAQRIFSIEDPSIIECDTEGSLIVENDNWLLRGRYDRVDYNADGTVTIIDYKSGKPPKKANERDKLRALMLYAGMFEILNPDLKVRDVKLVFLRSTPKGKIPVVVSAPVDSHEIDGGFMRVEAMAEAIQRGLDTGFKPKPGVLCGWCPYRDRCPEGDSYLRSKGK